MRENRPSGSEGGAGANPLFLPLSNPKYQHENCCRLGATDDLRVLSSRTWCIQAACNKRLS